jgi:hypothetical protein
MMCCRFGGVSRKTVGYYFLNLTQVTEEYFGVEVEVDESYFGSKTKGQQGRGTARKVPVFGLLKRGGKVNTRIFLVVSSVTCYLLFRRKYNQIALYILAVSVALIYLRCQSLNTTELTIQSCLQIRKIILME